MRLPERMINKERSVFTKDCHTSRSYYLVIPSVNNILQFAENCTNHSWIKVDIECRREFHIYLYEYMVRVGKHSRDSGHFVRK